MQRLPLPLDLQMLLFLAFFASFAVKVPMWPVHTWLPDAHVEAPTGGSVILAAIMLKIGAYGFLRFSLPIAARRRRSTSRRSIIALSLDRGRSTSAWSRWCRTDMKKLIAYSSIAHMGFVTLGFFMLQRPGRRRAALVQMISPRLRLGRDVPVRRRALRPHAHRARSRDYGGVVNTMPQLRRLLRAVRDGQLRPAGHRRASSASSW